MDHNSRVLPPGFDEQSFDSALDEIAKIVGEENISRDGKDGSLEGAQGQKFYGDTWPLAEGDEHAPSGAIRPSSVSEIQQILRVANKLKLPLWTVSRRKNLGYGGSAPVVRGTVVLDLHRMKRILEVNEAYAYAIVEPGVSFFDLYDHIINKGYELWPSVPAIGWGSVLGNTTERGFGYTPGGDHALQQCGMEVVLPNGELLRTGMGAMENSPMFALFKGGYGPSVDGLFYQSNLGIVTKIGIHLTPAPTHFYDCEVSVPNEADLEILVSKIARLEREKVIQNHSSIANVWRQAMMNPDPNIAMVAVKPGLTQGSHSHEGELTALQKQQGWGFWKAYFAIYAQSAALADGNWELVQRAFASVPGSKCECQKFAGKQGHKLCAKDTPEGVIPHNGVPRLTPLNMVNVRGHGGGHVDFSPLFPPGGKELSVWYAKMKELVKQANFDLFADFHVMERFTIGIICIIYGPNEGPRAKKLFEKLLKDAVVEDNTSEYRTHIDFMDDVANAFTFENSALRRFVTGLKDHLDPNGILSQGKSGIWSKWKSPSAQ